MCYHNRGVARIMPIIFQQGDNFWIEIVEMPLLTIPDAAGRVSSTIVTLEKSGRVVGSMIYQMGGLDNDNTQAIGQFDVRSELAAQLDYGLSITGVQWRITKQAGTAGNTLQSAFVILFMRKNA